jgi:hypothetical protein
MACYYDHFLYVGFTLRIEGVFISQLAYLNLAKIQTWEKISIHIDLNSLVRFVCSCLKVRWLLLSKVLFILKHIKIIFFLKKIIFDISTSKWYENIKNILI